MKKIMALVLAVLLAGLLGGCFGGQAQSPTEPVDYSGIKDDCVSPDGKFEIAFVTDTGQLKDFSFSQSIWEGVKYYASQNGKTYKYYQPDNHSAATDEDRLGAMKAAAEGGAQLIFCAGYLQETALKQAAQAYPQVMFVFIDGYQVTDSQGQVLQNVAAISFREEQAGYLAGYAAVMDGCRSLGFSGGGGGVNTACCRFGHGYLQGIQAAAAEIGCTVEVRFSWAYGEDFAASAKLENMLSQWYTDGTEVVFSCGGLMCQSAFAAAEAAGGKVIGVDVDQSPLSDTVVTSATKGLREAVSYACNTYYSGSWQQIGGTHILLGAAENAVGLATGSWKLTQFTTEQYTALLQKLKDGTLSVNSSANFDPQAFPNITLLMVEEAS